MNEKVINSFVTSAVRVLSTELGAQVRIGQPSAQGEHYKTQGVTAMIGVTGGLRGMVILGLSKGTALNLVSLMMGQEFESFDSLAESGIAELGNVMVGASVTSLAPLGIQCNITPPAVIAGENSVITTPNVHRLVIPLITPQGQIEMQLALRENGAH